MKKTLLILLGIVFFLIIFFFIVEKFYSPLQDDEFKVLFHNYNGKSKKICSVDFFGFNCKGEYFEVYKYKVPNLFIDSTYPKFKNKWENRNITIETKISKWNNCPIDSLTNEKFGFALTVNNFDKYKCISDFNKDIMGKENYYSYIYFNEAEYYFLLYCPKKNFLYYIRLKGF